MEFKSKAKELRIYERRPNNAYYEVATVPDPAAWEALLPALKRAPEKEFLLVRGTIEDSSYTEVTSNTDG